MYRGLDTETKKKILWHSIQVGSLAPEDKKRLADHANRAKILRPPAVANTLSVWANKGKNEIVLISSLEAGEPLGNVSGKLFAIRFKQWALQILKAIEYVHSVGIAPIDLNPQNIIITEAGPLLENVLCAQDLVTTIRALPADETIDTSNEGANIESLDALSFGVTMLGCILQEQITPQSFGELLTLLGDGRLFRLLDRVNDDRVKEFLSHCITPQATRWSIKQLIDDHALKETMDELEPEPLSPLSGPISPQASIGRSREDLFGIIEQMEPAPVQLVLVIDLNNQMMKVSFEFNFAKDSVESVAEELVQELGVSRQMLGEIATVIKTKLMENGRKTEDLLTLSPRATPISRKNVGSIGIEEDVAELKAKQEHEKRLLMEQHQREVEAFQRYHTDTADLKIPRTDQSCPSLIDIMPMLKSIKSGGDLKSMGEFERSKPRRVSTKVQRGLTLVATLVHLKKGAEDNDESAVKQLQEALSTVLGEDLHVDGHYGKKTEQLVKEFQERQGLEVTGIVEPQTWTSLTSEYLKLTEAWKDEDLVRELRIDLRDIKKS